MAACTLATITIEIRPRLTIARVYKLYLLTYLGFSDVTAPVYPIYSLY